MRNRIFRRGLSRQVGLLAMLAAIMLGSVAQAQGTRPVLTNETAATPAGADGPVQLRPSVRQVRPTVQDPNVQRGLTAPFFGDPLFPPAPLPRRELDEFEQFVSRLAGPSANGQPTLIRRFGTELQDRDPFESIDQEALPLVPPDYVVQPGDEIKVALWGSVDADLTLTVDRGGSITLPRVGGIVVAGARFSELNERVRRRASQTFKNFDVSVSMGKLRAVRVFVTGFVANPGTYTVGGLSTISRAVLRAGGPAPSGSYRQISLRRAGQPALTFDMYDLLVKGERRNDVTLRPDDVVHVGAVGPQVALIGSVNRPAIFELRPGETVNDVVEMAGGFSPVADISRLMLERLEERDKLRVAEWSLPEGASRKLVQGDVLRAISAVSANGSQLSRNKQVRVEGEVRKPGTYLLPPGSTLQDAIEAAGGLTTSAYVFGTEFTRESVRLGQQENYDRALRDVETEFARAAATQRASTPEEAAAQSVRAATTSRLIERLRALRPSGRVVLELTAASTSLPPLLIEDGDRLMIPAQATTVGVFGSVFSTGNYLYGEQRALGDYLRLAGGPTRSADQASVFVVRANGTVISASQSSGWFSAGRLGDERAIPGDTIFVPEEIGKTTFIQAAKDWTQILYQFGLGVAAFKSLSK